MEQRPQPRRRRRPALSCLECRRRKIKCDRNDPCVHCVSAKTQCTYKLHRDEASVRQHSPHGDSRTSPSGSLVLAPSLLTGSRQRSANRTDSEYGDGRESATQTNGTPQTLGRNDVGLPSDSQGTEPNIGSLLRRIERLEKSSTSSIVQGLSQTGRDILTRQLGLQNSQIMLNKTGVMTWSAWMGTAKEFAPIIACYTDACGQRQSTSFQTIETKSLIMQFGDLLERCKRLVRKIKLGRPSRSLLHHNLGLVPPSRESADKMAALYFQSFESTHRILHIPSFWTEYQRYWANPEDVATPSRLMILLVIGIGSRLYEHVGADDGLRHMAHQWVYAAQMWLSGPLEKDRLGVAGLQVYCLTMLARQIFSIGADLAWMSMGSLVHRAMQIGLHRDPKKSPTIPVLQAELRRRLWATIIEMLVQSSLDSAMPPRISFDEFDTEPPSNVNDDEIDETTAVLHPHPRSVYTATSLQLILLDSFSTRLRIVQLLNGLHSELYYPDVLTLSSEITDAHLASSDFMRKNEKFGVTLFHQNMVDYLVRRFLIPLHCPFACEAHTNPLFYFSLKISLDVAMAIISPHPDESFARLTTLGGGLFREGWRYATTVASMELIAQAEAQSLDGSLQRNFQSRELLKKAVKDMMALSLERIRQGDTKIKHYVFLSMIVALVEAAETGASRELNVAQSGRDSLEFCHNLLQERVENLALPGAIDTGVAHSSLSSEGGGYGLDLDFDLDIFLPDADFP